MLHARSGVHKMSRALPCVIQGYLETKLTCLPVLKFADISQRLRAFQSVASRECTIEIESDKGRGTTFRIKLPIHEKRTRLLEASREESAAKI